MQTRDVRGQKMPKNANVICESSLSIMVTEAVDYLLCIKNVGAQWAMVLYSKNQITSPKGFLASKCDVGNWLFSKS